MINIDKTKTLLKKLRVRDNKEGFQKIGRHTEKIPKRDDMAL